MSSRRRIPADLASVKKSRSSFTGAVTRALDKLKAMKSAEPEDIRTINTKEVDRLLTSLEKTETGFLYTLEDAQNFVPDGEGEEAFLQEEDLAMETFQEAISTARDLADRLLAVKSILGGLADFSIHSTSIQDFLADKPESNQLNSLQELKASYSSLKEEWKRANLPSTHSLTQARTQCLQENHHFSRRCSGFCQREI